MENETYKRWEHPVELIDKKDLLDCLADLRDNPRVPNTKNERDVITMCIRFIELTQPVDRRCKDCPVCKHDSGTYICMYENPMEVHPEFGCNEYEGDIDRRRTQLMEDNKI